MATVPSWGPSFIVSLNLYINTFDGENLMQDKWAELLRFTSTDNNCCAIGDRIPAIFANKGGFIQVATQLWRKGNRWKNINLDVQTWYNIEMKQFSQNNKVDIQQKYILTKIFSSYNCNISVFLRSESQRNTEMAGGEWKTLIFHKC